MNELLQIILNQRMHAKHIVQEPSHHFLHHEDVLCVLHNVVQNQFKLTLHHLLFGPFVSDEGQIDLGGSHSECVPVQ